MDKETDEDDAWVQQLCVELYYLFVIALRFRCWCEGQLACIFDVAKVLFVSAAASTKIQIYCADLLMGQVQGTRESREAGVLE